MRTAIYARYSSDLQDARSIDDQVALCRDALTKRFDGTESGIYADYAISGAHMVNRPQINQLVTDAKAGKFDAVLAEDLDRLSRDQEHIAAIHKQLTYHKVKILTVADGEINEMHIGLKGTMSAMFLKNLALKIKRGTTARAKAGSNPGGRCYGYDTVHEIGKDGKAIKGIRRINPEHARVITRIFREYANNSSPRAIAEGLNTDGIPGPTGGQWTASTINGNRARHYGILFNELYIGFQVYNRVQMIKHPDTGNRLSRPNPSDEWIVTEIPDLAILDKALWDAVQARKASISELYTVVKKRRPKHPLSGLARCGVCGGSYTITNRTAMACSTRRERGTCDNAHRIKMEDLERRVFDGLRDKLLSPAAIDAAISEYHAERARLRKLARANLQTYTRKRTDLRNQIGNIVNAIANGGDSSSLVNKLGELEDDLNRIEARLAEADDSPIIEIHPNALEDYKRAVAQLAETIRTADEPHRSEATHLIRSLIDHIEIHPTDSKRETRVDVFGILDAIKNLAGLPSGEASAQCTVKVVAEERSHQYSAKKATVKIGC
ncbi:recombinase family protein [Paremcibacter congregatus]|uniref:recombinase family protein n=1 Tax=Paremcibacter congregatus TaxID=2043170 RepID=UPI003A92CC8B